jgi:hypothetical protein
LQLAKFQSSKFCANFVVAATSARVIEPPKITEDQAHQAKADSRF